MAHTPIKNPEKMLTFWSELNFEHRDNKNLIVVALIMQPNLAARIYVQHCPFSPRLVKAINSKETQVAMMPF